MIRSRALSKRSFPKSAAHLFESCRDRDELFLTLLEGAQTHLDEVQLYLARRGDLRGHIAIDSHGIDDRRVRQRRLPLSLLSVACRVLEDGIPYLGPLPPTDPCVALVSPAALEIPGVALIPMRVGPKPLGLLIGLPRGPITRALRDDLVILAREAVDTLGRLVRARLNTTRHPVKTETRARHEAPAPGLHALSPPESKSAPLAVAPAAPAPPPPSGGHAGEEATELLTTPRVPHRVPPRQHDPAEESTTNRRAHRRERLRVEVHYTTEWGYFTGFMEDISEGGIFIMTYTRPPIGSETELTFTLPRASRRGYVECNAIAEVRWLRDPNVQGQQLPGMGLAFTEIAPAIRDFIREFIASL